MPTGLELIGSLKMVRLVVSCTGLDIWGLLVRGVDPAGILELEANGPAAQASMA